MSRALLKFSGGSIHNYATIIDDSPWTQHLASDGAKPQVLGWYRRAKATKRGGMDGEESECLRVPPKRGN